jgi:DNA-binding XRE family transcriptional regulator
VYAPNRIDARLTEVGMTKTKLAEHLGPAWDAARVCRLCAGRQQPGVRVALAVARILETTVEALWATEDVAH